MSAEYRAISSLHNWEHNPRTVTKEGIERLIKQIKKLGIYKPLIITEDGTVLGGNMRLKALEQMGEKNVWVSVIQADTEEKKIEYALSDNDRVGKYEGDQLANMIGNFSEVEWGDYAVDIKEPELVTDLMDSFKEVEEDEVPIKDIKDIKILNLYSCIGGNRKLWGELNITAVEINPEIAKVYQDYFPKDKMIITDAHKYLEEHFEEYDFIWASPPCPTHSRMRKWGVDSLGYKPIYPDMTLWQEVLFLQGYFKGRWCIENVITWYDPLIKPIKMGRHYYWTNFDIDTTKIENIGDEHIPKYQDEKLDKSKWGFDLNQYKFSSSYPAQKILNDMVNPKTGKYILEQAYKNSADNSKKTV